MVGYLALQCKQRCPFDYIYNDSCWCSAWDLSFRCPSGGLHDGRKSWTLFDIYELHSHMLIYRGRQCHGIFDIRSLGLSKTSGIEKRYLVLLSNIYFFWVSAFVRIFFALRPTDIQQVCSHTETAIFYIEIRLEWIQIRSLGSRLNEDTVPSYLEIRAMSVNSRRAEKACNPGSRLNFFYLTRASIAVSLKLLDFRCGTSYDYQGNCRPRTVGRFRLLFIPSIPDQGADRKICSPCFPPRSKGGTRYYNSNLWENSILLQREYIRSIIHSGSSGQSCWFDLNCLGREDRQWWELEVFWKTVSRAIIHR